MSTRRPRSPACRGAPPAPPPGPPPHRAAALELEHAGNRAHGRRVISQAGVPADAPAGYTPLACGLGRMLTPPLRVSATIRAALAMPQPAYPAPALRRAAAAPRRAGSTRADRRN